MVGIGVLPPVPLRPDDLHGPVINQRRLRVMNFDKRLRRTVEHAAGRLDPLRPAQAQKEADEIVEMDAQVAGLAVTELDAVAPRAGMDLRVVFVRGGPIGTVARPPGHRAYLDGPSGTLPLP